MSSDGKPRHLGVTPPISEAFATPPEVSVTNTLVESLKEHNMFESDEEARRREVVLGKLDRMVKDFVYKISSKKLAEPIAREAGGKIFTFGSYRLGVHSAGADIDTLCVVPRYVEREDFFTLMYEDLKARPEVTELAAVPDAYVPVMKMHFSDIPIDLVFARLGLISVQDDLSLADDNLLRNLDERCVRSLNGSRVTDEILRLVPNTNAFRTSLRCVKLWARRRAIYSNVMGFLGGVAWAMLVARVCQLYPNAVAGNIVSKFFRIMYQWNWPQPVMLKTIDEGPLQVRVWNPKLYPADKAHRMPIITPAYPSMCATHNVTSSTQKIMTAEFGRAADITDKVMVGAGSWSDVFAKHDFFLRYRYYLQIIASSDSPEQQLTWSGMVESRIRQLIMKLELVEDLELAHPFIKGFDKAYRCSNLEEEQNAAHGVFQEKKFTEHEGDAPSTGDNGESKKTIFTTMFYIGLYIRPREPGSSALRKLDISWPTQDFTKMVTSWDKYNENTMHIAVKYIKAHELPTDVFEEGEQRVKVLKRPKSEAKSATGSDQPNKKRRASNDVCGGGEKESKAKQPASSVGTTVMTTVKPTPNTSEVKVEEMLTSPPNDAKAAYEVSSAREAADHVISAASLGPPENENRTAATSSKTQTNGEKVTPTKQSSAIRIVNPNTSRDTTEELSLPARPYSAIVGSTGIVPSISNGTNNGGGASGATRSSPTSVGEKRDIKLRLAGPSV